ncbi:MAG: LysE family translocator [Pseudomonadota bacterium]|nr:LysE family translocator [Pseudomonadota bacterium]
MPLDLYLGFAAASAALILMPGPMVALIVSNSVNHGLKTGLLTVAGSGAAMFVHLIGVCAGLATLLAAMGSAFFWLKWAGAAYLFYLGVRALRSKPKDISAPEGAGKSVNRTLVEAFLVALTNPKTLLFYAAFFPLFISPDRAIVPQLALLSATFLVIACALDCGWAMTASRARPLLVRAGRWTNRVTGGVLILAAAGLAAARRI